MNGDDMYPTFRAFSPTDSLAVYVYSRFFVFVFVALFLYAVLNLFTSLVISSYEYSQVCLSPSLPPSFPMPSLPPCLTLLLSLFLLATLYYTTTNDKKQINKMGCIWLKNAKCGTLLHILHVSLH